MNCSISKDINNRKRKSEVLIPNTIWRRNFPKECEFQYLGISREKKKEIMQIAEKQEITHLLWNGGIGTNNLEFTVESGRVGILAIIVN
jgi:hypothetical protein